MLNIFWIGLHCIQMNNENYVNKQYEKYFSMNIMSTV